MKKDTITVNIKVNRPVEKVWECWTQPEHIKSWNNASDNWVTPSATNDLKEGGKFVYRMEAKDGSAAFDFQGTYKKVIYPKFLKYILDDMREVEIKFEEKGDATLIEETFETEKMNSAKMQKNGWQVILDNFKKYVESEV
ncbi:polyketide cyclase [Christiangramia fulva]|uniref:Polyketide cyclase n=1 Tax=Christiangramia fulva TaxID=2126553 RepID=A0A2R3Z168_9FLAO|nr:SRPBCC domain-containing protein [Christiangramia fulva]AVR43996.1 polyketide cyclase [Christiangramia fulva]